MRILNKDNLISHGNAFGRKIVAELLDAGIDSINPYYRVKKFMSIADGVIKINNVGFEMKGDPHSGAIELPLKNYEHIYAVVDSARDLALEILTLNDPIDKSVLQ